MKYYLSFYFWQSKNWEEAEWKLLYFYLLQHVEINITEFLPYMACLPPVRKIWVVQPSFEDNIVSKGDSEVYVKCCVIWWLLVLVIKLHAAASANRNLSGKKIWCCHFPMFLPCPFLWKHNLAFGEDFHTLQKASSSKTTFALKGI